MKTEQQALGAALPLAAPIVIAEAPDWVIREPAPSTVIAAVAALVVLARRSAPNVRVEPLCTLTVPALPTPTLASCIPPKLPVLPLENVTAAVFPPLPQKLSAIAAKLLPAPSTRTVALPPPTARSRKLAHDTAPPAVILSALPPRNSEPVVIVKVEPAPLTLIVAAVVWL